MFSQRLIHAFVDLTDRDKQDEAATAVARSLGANSAVLFVRDAAVGRSLPAPGFPQTLPSAKSWHTLVARAVAEGSALGVVATSAKPSVPARAFGTPEGTVLVLTGITDESIDLAPLLSLLTLVGRYFAADAARKHAETEARLSRQSATEASDLASKLDRARGELQRALGVAEQATRLRDDFLANVSHELRTPLTSILGWIQLIRGENDQKFLDDAYDTIERNARAQGRLIEDLLDFSRIHAGKLRPEVRPVDLVAIANAAIDVVRPAAEVKRLRLLSVLDREAAQILGDENRLQQIVWNLLSNSVKFTQPGGRVEVRLARVNSYAELSVSDTGDGIAAEFLPYVFDRFSQAETGSTRTYGGLGLGLGIVRHLVELHGGTVRASSEGPGKGSTFIARFPLIAA